MTCGRTIIRRAASTFACTLFFAALSMPGMAAANPDPNTPWIRYDGHSGPAVRCLQYILKYCTGHEMPIDGVYGPTTRQGVIDMQRFFGLQQDGIVGPDTGEAFKLVGSRCAVPYVGWNFWEAMECQPVVPTRT